MQNHLPFKCFRAGFVAALGRAGIDGLICWCVLLGLCRARNIRCAHLFFYDSTNSDLGAHDRLPTSSTARRSVVSAVRAQG